MIFKKLEINSKFWILLFLGLATVQFDFGQSAANPDIDIKTVYQKANLVYNDYMKGDELKALRCIDELIGLSTSGYNDVIWGFLFNYKAIILHHQGNFYLSKKYFQLSIAFAELFRNEPLRNYSINSCLLLLVESFDTKGVNLLTENYLNEWISVKSDKLLFAIHTNQAYSAIYNHDTARARIEFQKLNSIGKRMTKEDPYWINEYRLFGIYLMEIGNNVKSLDYLKRAIELSENINGEMHFQTGLSYLRLGDYYLNTGKSDTALYNYEKANHIIVEQSIDLSSNTLQYSYETVFIECLIKLGRLLQTGETDVLRAFENFKMAIGRINQLSHSITSETSRFIIAEKGRYCFDAGIACALELSKKTGEVSFLEQALAWSIESKSLSLNQQFEKDQIYPVVGIPEELAANQQQFRQSLDNYLGESFDEKAVAPIDTIITTLRNYEKNERLIQSLYDKIRQVKEQNRFSPQKLLNNVNDAIYVGFHELDSVIAVFSQDGAKLQCSYINKDKKLLSDLVEFRTLISHTPINIYTAGDIKKYSDLGYSLYTRLIGPCLSHFHGRHILIQSDGCLLGIPFEALVREATDSDSFRDLPYLVKDFAVQYVSISMLTELPNVLGKKDLLLVTCRNSTGISEADIEVSRLHAAYSKSSLCFLDDAGFNSNSLNLSNSRIHIASHAVVNSPDPIQSGLTCSPDEPPRLKFSDILRLNLKGGHVFINGCQSGNGPLNHGEGLMSLGLAFAMAGSGSVIQHLWTASDRSSMELAGLFYKKLHRFSDADALQIAKKKYLKSSYFGLDHPYYWSGMVCFSGSKEASRHLAIYLIILALLSCGTLIYMVSRKRTR